MIHNLEKAAEAAVFELPNLIAKLHDLELQARQAEHNLKHVEGTLIAHASEPVSIRKEVVRSDEGWAEAAELEAHARAALVEAKYRIEHCNTVISLYQSELRQRTM